MKAKITLQKQPSQASSNSISNTNNSTNSTQSSSESLQLPLKNRPIQQLQAQKPPMPARKLIKQNSLKGQKNTIQTTPTLPDDNKENTPFNNNINIQINNNKENNCKPTLYEEDSIQSINQVLPIRIAGMRIKKLQWSDFKGEPNYEMPWKAHIYWGINYSYDVQIVPSYGRKAQYRLNMSTVVTMKDKSWKKVEIDHLLYHEQGHYLIGCLCALEFQRKCREFKFSSMYKQEVDKLFKSNLREWCALEKRYDDETEHRLNFPEQDRWDRWIIKKLSEHYNFFHPKQNTSSENNLVNSSRSNSLQNKSLINKNRVQTAVSSKRKKLQNNYNINLPKINQNNSNLLNGNQEKKRFSFK